MARRNANPVTVFVAGFAPSLEAAVLWTGRFFSRPEFRHGSRLGALASGFRCDLGREHERTSGECDVCGYGEEGLEHGEVYWGGRYTLSHMAFGAPS